MTICFASLLLCRTQHSFRNLKYALDIIQLTIFDPKHFDS